MDEAAEGKPAVNLMAGALGDALAAKVGGKKNKNKKNKKKK